MSWTCERGTVFAEFLIAFPVVFVLFLGIVQLSLIGAASLVVRHAAYRAAREASLVIDEDPEYMKGSARGALKVASDGSSSHGPRMKRIEAAAAGALHALAPPASALAAWAQGGTPALDEGALSSGFSRVASALVYTRKATEWQVGHAPAAGGLTVVAGQKSVPIQLTYRYVCAVPVVNAMICDSIVDVPGSDALQDALGFELPRWMKLSATAHAIVHSANYVYRSQHDDG